MDELEVYERVPGGPIPIILLDAHNTRLQIPALSRWNRRIIGNDPAWKASIGLPNGTSLWQVGDSSEQNGSWKMGMTREKDALMRFKERMELPYEFKRRDVMPLVHRAAAASFRRKESNLKATRERG